MIIYGVEESYVLKEGRPLDHTSESLKATKEWGWNEDKTVIEKMMKHLLETSNRQKKYVDCDEYVVYKIIEKDITKQVFEGEVSFNNNGLDYEDNESWIEVNNQNVDEILSMYQGKKVRVTIEAL